MTTAMIERRSDQLISPDQDVLSTSDPDRPPFPGAVDNRISGNRNILMTGIILKCFLILIGQPDSRPDPVSFRLLCIYPVVIHRISGNGHISAGEEKRKSVRKSGEKHKIVLAESKNTICSVYTKNPGGFCTKSCTIMIMITIIIITLAFFGT